MLEQRGPGHGDPIYRNLPAPSDLAEIKAMLVEILAILKAVKLP